MNINVKPLLYIILFIKATTAIPLSSKNEISFGADKFLSKVS